MGLLLLPGLAQAQSLLRFDVADGGQAATFQQSSVSRERTAGAEHPVQVDVALLRAAPPRLELATPDGRLLTAALTHFEDRGGGDVLWSGRIVGAGYDTVLLAVRAGRVVGSYREPARPAYSLRSDASGLGVVTAPSTGEAPVEDFPAESPFCQEVHAPLDPDAPESPMLPPPVSRDPTSIPDSSFEESAIVASTPPTGVARAQTAVTVTLTAAPGTVEEDAGSAQTITVTAEITAGGTFGTDQTILVSVGGGRATADVDYVAVADFSITLAASMTSGSASFALSPTNDTDREAHENVIVSGTLTGATVVPAEIWITDDDQHRIDLMILHTPEAAAEMTHSDGSTYTPTSIAGEFVDYANMVWRNAAFPAHLRLVHVGPVPARVLDNPLEGTPFVTAMRADAEVLRLREQYGADLVHLAIRVPGSIPLPCGLAYTRVAAHTTELMAPSGFGWFNVDNVCVQPGSNFVWGPGWGSILVHEIGHNLGLNHDPAHFTGSRYPPVAPYAFGHTDIRAGQTNVATIMSYGTDRSCRFVLGRLFCNDTFTREPFYSTVRIRGPDGAILGIADERENERAAWLTLASTERFDEFMQAAPPASLTGTVTANGDSVDVALTWNDVSTRETHFDVQYRIYGQAWRDGATLVANVQGTTLMGLAPATRYGFRVAATNAWGWTSYSYEWVTRTPGSGPPTPPANLRATTPGSQLIQGRVDLTWDDFAESETGFLVQYRELGAADWVDDPSLPADTTSAAVTGLLPDQDYEFRVGATNGHGAAWSLPVTARTDAPRPPTKPDGLVGLRLSSTTVLLSWGSSSDDVSLYEIQMRPHGAGAAWNSIAEAPRDVETKVVGNLPEGARLDFRVVALGLGGQARGDDVITVDLSVEPPGVPALAVRADRDSRNRAVARFRVSVEPLNGAEVYVERQVEVLRERRWRRVTDDVELGRDYDYFRAVAENAGGRRTSRIARLRDPGRELVRAPRRLAAEQTGPTEVRLTWEDRASDELWYRVGLSRDGGAEAVYAVYPPDTAEATLTGLWPGSYEFGLSVANAHGGISPRTVALTLVPPDPSPPPAASGLTASHGATSTEVELSWTDNSSDETGFRVGARPDDGAWTYTDVAADAVTATVSNLMADTLYHFRVLAESPRGSLESNRAILDLQRTPRPPTGLRARADGSTSVVLSWKDEAVNETGYRIEYRPGGGSWVQDGALAAADAESRAVTGLAPSTAYGFRVVAVNAAGENATDEVTLTMPPAAPSNLQVSASSATSAALTWTDNSSDETGFLIQYRASDQTGWTVWAPDPAADAGSAAIEGLTPGSDYEFRVFAHGDHGTSSPSNVASVTDFPRLPEAPSGLSVSFLDSNACAVSWTDNSSDETGFLIQYRLVGRTEWDAGPAFPADATAGTLGGLLPSRTYRFRVLARNANGARPSFQREATSPPAAPTELEASRASATMANLEWVDNARDETGFLVEERRGANPWYPIGRVANPRASIGGIVPLAVRDWRVRAYNDNGVSAPSNAVTYVERSAPPAPAGLTAVATGSTSVDLSWVDNSDVEGGFRVERRAAGETTWTTGGAVAADATGASVTGLVASTAYTFRVVAFNANGVGESDPVSLTMPPPAPTGLSASLATSTSAQLAWTDNASDEDGYLAQYSDGSAWTTALTTASGATSAVVSGLTAGSGYEFRVLATNANGDSSPSNVVGLGPPLAPPAPSGLVAAAAGSTSVNLSWSDGSSNETGFQVEYQPSGGAWTAASTTPPDTEAAVVTGLAPSTGYQFRVTATNANGSASSGVASLVMPPAAPTGLSARAGAANAVDLAWTDAASDESEFLVEYRRRVDSAWTAWGTRPAANASAASVTGLLGGTEYLFRVRAVHATNGASTPSNVAATSTSGTRVPSGLRVAATDSTSASASWEDESHDETGFVVERRRTGGDWNVAAAVDVDVESAVLTGLEPSAAYDFRVGATGAGGSAWSGTVSLTMPPAAPVGLEAAAVSSTSARLTWTDTSSDETSFVIEFREESAPDWGLWPGEAAADAETWTATGLDPGKAYAFRVYAKHSTNGVSSPSNEARTGNLGAPQPPSGLAAAAAGSTTVNLTWTDDATDETGFLVEYRSGAAAWRTSSSPSADAESAAATGLTASRGYEFRVSALNARGSTPSSSVTLVMPPAPPRRIRAEAGDGADVLVIWDDGSEDETGYALEYRLSSATAWTEWSADLPTNPTSALVTGLAAGASYQFRAFALHPRNGRSSPSDVATVNMVGAPAAPSGLVSLPRGSTEVSLTWIDNSSNETAFDVEQRTGTGPWSTVATNGPDVNWATITGLSPSTAYGFRVSARNANGATPGGAVSQTMPPAAPTNLVATEWKPASDNPGVELTWTDNATDERDFLVEYRAAGDEAWLAFSTRPPADSTSFVATGLTPDTAYEFRVFATSRHGNSSPSNVATVAGLGVPEAPTDFAIEATGSTTALATWTDASTKEAVFRVQRRAPGAEEWTEAAIANRNETSIEVPNLLPSTAYEFRVVSWTVSGASGSNVVGLTMPPAPPADLTAAPASPTSVSLTWTDASRDETSFVAEYKRGQRKDWTVFGTEAAANATSLTVTGLVSGQTYDFRVYARHGANGRSSPSNQVRVRKLGTAGVPADVSVTASGSTSVVVAWTDNGADETGFRVEYRIGRSPWATGAETGANSTTATVTGLLPSTSYEFRVSSLNAHGAAASDSVLLVMPPAAPTGLVAAGDSATGVRLDWTDASTDEARFVAEYREAGATAWTAFGTAAAANATSITVTGLTSGRSYEFRVFAENDNGRSSPSGVASPAGAAAPVAPSGATAVARGSTTALIAWSDNSTDETGFDVEYRVGSAAWRLAARTAASVTRLAIAGLEASTAYEFRVSARNGNGASAAAAAPVLTMPPAAPTGLTATRTSSTGVLLGWTDNSSDETAFVVEYKTLNAAAWSTFGTEAAADATSIAVTGLATGTRYVFRVFAKHSVNGLSTPSYTVSVHALGAPAAPTGLTATASAPTAVALAWTDASNTETGFRVEARRAAAGVPWTLDRTVLPGTTSATVARLRAGAAYEFRVGAENSAGVSYAATVAARTPADSIPMAPTGLVVTGVGPTRVRVDWTDRAGNEAGYIVSYRFGAEAKTVWSVYPADQETALFTGLGSGQYTFFVRATNAVGESAEASASWSLPRPSHGPPKAATRLNVKLTGPYTAELRWRDRADDETEYLAALRADDGAWRYASSAPDSTRGFFHGLLPGETYHARVIAYHADNGGINSNVVTFENPADEPRAARDVTVTPTGSTSLVVAWEDVSREETGYEVQYRIVEEDPDAGDEAPWTTAMALGPNVERLSLDRLLSSTTYRFAVWTIKNGKRESSEVVEATMPPPPPVAAAARPASASSAEVSWTDASTDETSFQVEHRLSGAAAWTASAGAAGADETAFVVTGLEGGSSYEFRVFARHDVNGLSSPSNVARTETAEPTLTIAGLSSGTVAENVAYASATPTVTGHRAPVTWTTEGADAANFTIASGTGALSMVARDHEDPQDDDLDNVYEVTVKATDADGVTGTVSIAVTVTDVNEAPAFSTATALSISVPEGTTGNIGGPVTATDPEGAALVYSLTGTDAAAFDVSSSGQLSVASGTTLNHEQKASYGFNVVVSDGATPSPLTATRVVTVTVTDVDESLTITGLSSGTVAENVAYASATPSVSGHRGAVTWTTEGADAADFTIASGTGALSMVARDHEDPQDDDLDNVYEVTVKATDADGVMGTVSIAVTVTDVNEAPAFSTATALSISVPEGTTGNIGGPVTATDPEGAALVYSLTGTDAAAFDVSSSGQLSVASGTTLNHEQKASYGFNVVVSDGATPSPLTATRVVTVTVTDVDESLTITGLSSGTVAENVAYASATPSVSGHRGAVTWTTEGADAADFTIASGTGALSMVARDHEDPQDDDLDNVYEVTVKATDADGVMGTASITVTVTDVNEPPAFSTATALSISVPEGTTGNIGGPVTATDPEGAALVYSLTGADAAAFQISATGQLSLASGTVLDYERKSSYGFNVVVSDGATPSPLTATRAVTVTVTDVTEILTIAGLSSGPVAENVAYASATPSVSGHRAPVTWTTEGADAGDFTIASGTGALSMVARDHEDPQDANTDNVYEVTVKATDADGETGTASIAVTVTDVNEPPVFSTATALSISVPEGTTGNVGSPVTATDPEGASLVYSLTGADAAAFDISSSGQLSVASGTTLDHERKSSYAFNVVVADSATPPFWRATRAVTVSVTAVEVGVSPPAAPAGVTVEARGSTSVLVTWTDASIGETGFTVEYGTVGGAWTSGATVIADVTSATVTGLSASTAYDFRVSSVNARGSSPSSAVSLTMPPAAPSGPEGSATDATSATVTWTDESSDETGFVVEHREARTEAWTAFGAEAAPGAASLTVTGLAAGASHDFRVFATHSSNGRSSPTAVVRVGAWQAPTPPANLEVAVVSSTSVRLTWEDLSDDETGFEIEYREAAAPAASPGASSAGSLRAGISDGGARFAVARQEANPGAWRKHGAEAPADATSIVVTGLSAETEYEFRVIAKSAAGLSTPSPVREAATERAPTVPVPTGPPSPPPPPPNRPPSFDATTPLVLTVTEGAAGVIGSVNARDPDGDDVSYRLEAGRDASSFRVAPETGDISVAPLTTLDASRKDSYRFVVVASDGVLSASRAVTVEIVEPEPPGATPPPKAPAPPSDLEATLLTSEAVALSWRDNADDETRFDPYYRENLSGWRPLRSRDADAETATIEDLSAGIEYEFVVVAVSPHGEAASNVAAVELSLAPPTHLDASPLSEASALVTWRDDSIVETGFEVQLRRADPAGGDDAGNAGEGGTAAEWTAAAAVGPNVAQAVVEGLEPGTGYRFRVAALDARPGARPALSRTATFTLGEPPQPGAMTNCETGETAVALSGGYDARMCFEMPSGARMEASDYHLESTASGLLYFFDRDNVEVLVKVLDGCNVNGHKWVFAAPVTDLAFNLEIEERSTGRTFTHRNARGRTAATASDTAAFPCEPAGGDGVSAAAAVASGEATLVEHLVNPTATDEPPVCEPEGPGIVLEDGHRVDMCFALPNGEIRQARDWGLPRRSSALLHFFDRDNAEVLVKVLDGCNVNGHEWVFAAPVTDLAFHLAVTDPEGNRWSHTNQAGRTAMPGSDTAAFKCE